MFRVWRNVGHSVVKLRTTPVVMLAMGRHGRKVQQSWMSLGLEGLE